MTAIVWDEIGERYFETGLDRGVLYPGLNAPGVPWNGLISIEEIPNETVTPLYFDGIKYMDHGLGSDFQANLTAFTYPEEFNEFDGALELSNGFYATNQIRNLFGLSYRTKIGNDVDQGLGYKIHLIYNILATPTGQTRSTEASLSDPTVLKWKLSATPVLSSSIKPTAHVFIDSRKHSADTMQAIENYLYGTESGPAYLPVPDQINEILLEASDPGILEPIAEPI